MERECMWLCAVGRWMSWGGVGMSYLCVYVYVKQSEMKYSVVYVMR